MKLKKLKYNGKVSAVVTFFNQSQFKKKVLASIKPQVDEVIVVEDKGTLKFQRDYGLSRAKHEFVLFCDGDIIVGENFVKHAKQKFKDDYYTGVVGGMITNPMETPAQELMAVLRFRAFFKSN